MRCGLRDSSKARRDVEAFQSATPSWWRLNSLGLWPFERNSPAIKQIRTLFRGKDDDESDNTASFRCEKDRRASVSKKERLQNYFSVMSHLFQQQSKHLHESTKSAPKLISWRISTNAGTQPFGGCRLAAKEFSCLSQHVQQFRGAHTGLGLDGFWPKRPKVVLPPLGPSHFWHPQSRNKSTHLSLRARRPGHRISPILPARTPQNRLFPFFLLLSPSQPSNLLTFAQSSHSFWNSQPFCARLLPFSLYLRFEFLDIYLFQGTVSISGPVKSAYLNRDRPAVRINALCLQPASHPSERKRTTRRAIANTP